MMTSKASLCSTNQLPNDGREALLLLIILIKYIWLLIILIMKAQPIA